MQGINRRSFLKTTAAASAIAGFHVLPSYGEEPKEKVKLAIIGCSHQGGGIGQGAVRTGMCDVVALCDVNPSRAGKFKAQFPKAKVYSDFRKMFDDMGDQLDACTAGVPDHAPCIVPHAFLKLGALDVHPHEPAFDEPSGKHCLVGRLVASHFETIVIHTHGLVRQRIVRAQGTD